MIFNKYIIVRLRDQGPMLGSGITTLYGTSGKEYLRSDRTSEPWTSVTPPHGPEPPPFIVGILSHKSRLIFSTGIRLALRHGFHAKYSRRFRPGANDNVTYPCSTTQPVTFSVCAPSTPPHAAVTSATSQPLTISLAPLTAVRHSAPSSYQLKPSHAYPLSLRNLTGGIPPPPATQTRSTMKL